MWAQFLGGQPWHGTMINRRKSGELFEEDVTISPIHDPEGRLSAYVAVKRDLTVERRRRPIARASSETVSTIWTSCRTFAGALAARDGRGFCRAATDPGRYRRRPHGARPGRRDSC